MKTLTPTFELRNRAECVQRAALQRLLETRQDDGRWVQRFAAGPLHQALFTIMLRTTGLIESASAKQQEVRVVRYLLKQTNSDGGFFKFAGTPSCRSVTRLSVTALRLALGQVQNGAFPPAWFAYNEHIEDQQSREIRKRIDFASMWIARNGHVQTSLRFEVDHFLLDALLSAYVDPSRCCVLFPMFNPTVGAAMTCVWPLTTLHYQLSRVFRKSLPALSILYSDSRARSQSPALAVISRLCGLRRLDEFSVNLLVDQLRANQNENGAWLYNPGLTMLNAIALRASGTSLNDRVFQRAVQYVNENIVDESDGSSYLAFMSSDFWDTCSAVWVYLTAPGTNAHDGEIRTSIDYLLQCQANDGSFSFADRSSNDPDSDSTGFAVRVLALAAESASGSLRRKIEDAIDRGCAYTLAHQNRSGGYAVWDGSVVPCRPGFPGFVRQVFDTATPDTTARVLVGLRQAGVGLNHGAIHRGVRFLVKTQHRDGSWWCRWWRAFIPGTAMVVDFLSELGLTYSADVPPRDDWLRQAHHAMLRGVKFLADHQNADGGWGEGPLAEIDDRYAGKGKSTPTHTGLALFALIKSGYPVESPVICRGVEFLLRTATDDGRWLCDEPVMTVLAPSYYYAWPFLNMIFPVLGINQFLRRTRVNARSA